jgi:hypothetical protein
MGDASPHNKRGQPIGCGRSPTKTGMAVARADIPLRGAALINREDLC